MTYSLVFRLVFLASLFFLIMAAFPAEAALPGYMTVEGAQQGPIEGDSTLQGEETAFEINELHHLSNAGSQGAEHQPLIVTTPMSKGVPSLLRALDTGELLNVSIRLYRRDSTGAMVNYYTITLQNARLVVGEPILPDTHELPDPPSRIRLRFEFDSIIHDYELEDESVEL